VDIRIGIANTPREISFESAQTPEEIEKIVAASFESTFLKLADNKGKTYLVPTPSVAYVEIGSDQSRRIGFA
jgi:hypothetical protein